METSKQPNMQLEHVDSTRREQTRVVEIPYLVIPRDPLSGADENFSVHSAEACIRDPKDT